MVDDRYVTRTPCVLAARAHVEPAALASRKESSMGQPAFTPARRTPGGVRSAARRSSRSGASAEGGGVVYSRHHRSRRRRAAQDRRGKWTKIPLPNPAVAKIGTGRVPKDPRQQKTMTQGCRWRAVAAGCYQKALQHYKSLSILLKVAWQQKNKALQGAQEQITELKKKEADMEQDAAYKDDELAAMQFEIDSLEEENAHAHENEVALKKQVAELTQQIKSLKSAHKPEETAARRPPQKANSPDACLYAVDRPPEKKKGRQKDKKPQEKRETVDNMSERLAAEMMAKFRDAMKPEFK